MKSIENLPSAKPSDNDRSVRSVKVMISLTPEEAERAAEVKRHEGRASGREKPLATFIYAHAIAAINRKYEKLTAEEAVA